MSTNYNNTPIIPSEWISQAEAARLRGVTRQAISKLVKKGRLRTVNLAGRTLVNRFDVENFEPLEAGRPKAEEPDAEY